MRSIGYRSNEKRRPRSNENTENTEVTEVTENTENTWLTEKWLYLEK